MRKYIWPIRIFLALLLLQAMISPASAQRGAGVRAGVSANPDQFYVGGHIMAGPVAKDLWFRPNMEVGFGNNSSLVGLNGEFAYMMKSPKTSWNPYFGGGPALVLQTSGGSIYLQKR